ncbi:MAG: insulinase family protein [Chitinophagales bacterium]|nr:insulinase family protein [Chitinophagaceae bacterium]MCB9064304.1 insulinase family protein [Chitinophagales bacterium]
MKRIVSALVAVVVLSTSAFGKAKLVEKVTKKGDQLVIPYERYVLDNGLTVIVHEDHSDPIVHVDVTYHVGSAREEIGKSGFAHFFEHMMFQGSDNVADEQHFKIITEAGGTLNGTTNTDRTNYFETVPSNQLEKMLWLEADRMGFLLDAVTQKKFEVQRATVKNERGQRYDNVPYGLVREFASKNLYPYGHPYSWLTIGYIEDLNRVNVDDLKNFFLRWYGPNNAVLTVGGDVNTQDVLKMAEKYFGSIPRGPEVTPTKLPAVQLEKNRYVSMVDNYAKIPLLSITYPTVANYHPDEAPLDCLAEILGQGKNSIFYKNFIKSQKAVRAIVSHPCQELAGNMSITVMPYPGQKMADMQMIVDESLAEFEQRGVTDEDIEKFRNSMESNLINGLESVSGKVSALAAFYTFTGDADRLGKELKRYTAVTKEDVMRVYNKYMKGKNRLVVSCTPKGQEDNIAAADNYTVSEAGYKAPDYGYKGLKYVKAKDNFDRSKVPGTGPNPVVNVPEFWTKTLPGNVRVIGTQSDEIPVVTVLMEFKGGEMLDSKDFSKIGLANMFASMMDEDTKNYTAEQMSVELDKIGSSINFSSSMDGINVSVRTLSKNFDRTMELLEEKLMNPVFDEETFNRNKKRLKENIKNSKVRPTYVASTVYSKLQYGTNNILGWPSSGTEETLDNIKLSDIENFYKNNMSRNEAKVIVVGDISQDHAISHLAFLEKMPDNKITLPILPGANQTTAGKVYFVDIPGAAQTEFRIGKITGMTYDALGDYYKATLMSYPLGGAFNCRINLQLREERGWTYGARSYFSANKYTGSYTFSSGIKANATDSALADFIKITNEFKKNGMTKEELQFTQSSIGQRDARNYESGYQKAGFLSRILDYNLPADYPQKQNEILAKMTVADMKKLTDDHLPSMKEMTILLVGDKATVLDNVKKMGYEVIELDADGNPVME